MNGRKWGVLLLAMGGPDGPDGVRPFIGELLADPDMVRLPLGRLWQRRFATMIARRRARSVIERYRAIGGASPVGPATAAQAEGIGVRLGVPAASAMRYTAPRVGEALSLLAERGVRSVVALPMYPQYSGVSTGSALRDLAAAAGAMNWTAVANHATEPGLVLALADAARQAIGRAGGKGVHLLFTAHGIPLSYTRAGDPYVGQVEATVAAVRARLPECAWSLAFQSRLGPTRWHGPSPEAELDRLAGAGVRRVAVAPVSFATENLETLWDLDLALAGRARELGFEHFERAAAPGCHPAYLDGLAGLVRRQADRLQGQGDA